MLEATPLPPAELKSTQIIKIAENSEIFLRSKQKTL